MFYYLDVETPATSCSPFAVRGMTVSWLWSTIAIHDPNGLPFQGRRALDFTCCDVEPAILGKPFVLALELRGGLTPHSKEHTSPHDDRRQPISG